VSDVEIGISDLLRFVPEPESPALACPGLRLAARGATFDGERLRFELLVTWRFPEPYVASFARLSNALVFVVEDALQGAVFAARAIDPFKDYVTSDRPSWDGSASPAVEGGALRGGWVTIPLEVTTGLPPWRGAALHATVVLHDQLSNTLGLALRPGGAVAVSSWLAGRPCAVGTFADEERSGPLPEVPVPPSASPSLGLVPRPETPGAFQATLRLTPEELAAGGAEGWLRSVFVVAVSRTEQLSFVAPWLGERLVAPDDLSAVTGGSSVALPFGLAQLFGPMPPDTYDVHVAARHHRSAVLQVVLS
jgi:hypothetical protein